MVGLIVAGIVLLAIGVGAIAYGVPINEFGLGNTLIVSGTVAACTGAIMLGLAIVVRELRRVSRLGAIDAITGPAAAFDSPSVGGRAPIIGAVAPVAEAPTVAAVPPAVELAVPPQPGGDPEAAGDQPAADQPGAPKPRRNLLFQSTSRRERERAQGRADVQVSNPDAAIAPPADVSPIERPGPSFDDSFAQPDPNRSRPRPAAADTPRSSAATADNTPRRTAPAVQPQVSVIKSGVVDGMAYSLYSDGSIEAQLAEGMMRFASIDELRQHLDQRG